MLVNAGAVELVAATVEQGASSEPARAWWGNFLVQKANEAGVELDALAITPAQVAAVVQAGRRRQAVQQAGATGRRGVCWPARAEPEQVMTDRGLALVRDDSLIQAAVDEALAANPDVVEKNSRRQGRGGWCHRGRRHESHQGSGRRGTVRELVLQACG